MGQPIIKALTARLALKMIDLEVDKEFDFIASNATGGMVPGWQLMNYLQDFTGKSIPYVYVRDTRKLGGHKEHITGDRNNPLIVQGNRALVFEEPWLWEMPAGLEWWG